MSPEQLVDSIDFPHQRVPDWVWAPDSADPEQPLVSRNRLILFAKMLRERGIPDAEIKAMFSDLYWDSFNECLYNEAFCERHRL